MLASGVRTRDIAAKMGVKRESVNGVIRQIYLKTGFETREEVIAWAVEHSMDDPSILEIPRRRRINPKLRGFFQEANGAS